jgi:HAD superfamily hydrolase (TIGR01509 family)
MTSSPRQYRGVIVDVDGTLVDSNEAHAQAWHQAFREHGLVVPIDRIRGLIGMGGEHVLRAAADLDDASRIGQSISRRRGEIFTVQYLPRLKAFPRARDLLLRMREAGLILAIGSSGEPAEVDALLALAEVRELISARSSAEDAARSKPDPDIIRAAFGKVHLSPHEVLCLGDTRYDVAAAARAGIGCVGLRSGGSSTAELAGAIAIYDNPADLWHRFADSPFAT